MPTAQEIDAIRLQDLRPQTKGNITIYKGAYEAQHGFVVFEIYPATLCSAISRRAIQVQMDGITPDGTIFPNQIGQRLIFRLTRRGRWVIRGGHRGAKDLAAATDWAIQPGSAHFEFGVQELLLCPF